MFDFSFLSNLQQKQNKTFHVTNSIVHSPSREAVTCSSTLTIALFLLKLVVCDTPNYVLSQANHKEKQHSTLLFWVYT
jgi:hypothetical protein